jgi:predicted permease
MDRLAQDLRFTVRLLWRDRGFAATAILTLALCIGANSAIFAVVHSVLLRPLPVPQPDRLVTMYNSYPRAGVERASNGVPDYDDRLRETDVFEEVALYNTRGVTVGTENGPERITAMAARPSLLRLLGAQPVRGRIFLEKEGEQGSDAKVILTHALWQQLYAGADVLGTGLRINGVPHEIVGVLPSGFHYLSPDVRLWLPLSFTPEQRSDDARHNNNWSMVARLKPGATVATAQQQIDALNARNLERFAHIRALLENAGFHTVVRPLQEAYVEDVRGTLYLLWGGVLFVLLIGGVNLTNLVLARSTSRMRELATRQALGAGLRRLSRQLFTESLLITAAGGALGVLLGYAGLAVLSGSGLERLPRGGEIGMDLTVVLFSLALALAIGFVVALAPVVALRRADMSQVFLEEGRSGTSGRGTRRLRRVLVVSQVALAFMLLAGAGALLASFAQVLAIDPGFDPHHVLTARIAPPPSRYAGNDDLRAFGERFLDRARALPGVQQAALASNVPFGGDYSDGVIMAEGYTMAPGESVISPYRISITPGFFEALGAMPRAGRTFTPSDTPSSPGVVIVDERLARRFWGATDPLGRRMYLPERPEDLIQPGPHTRWLTVVGVVPELRISGLVANDDRIGAYYLPMAQLPQRNVWLVVRSAQDPALLVPALRRELGGLDAELPLFNVRSMPQRIEASLTDRRTPMVLAVTFAALALFLAAVGIYGVLAYQVAQRRREIGIRMALGSGAPRVFRLVLGEGLVLMAAGLLAGLAGAFTIRRVLAAQLYGTGPMDPAAIGAAAAVLAAVALVACAIPARRAARTDPLAALAEQ